VVRTMIAKMKIDEHATVVSNIVKDLQRLAPDLMDSSHWAVIVPWDEEDTFYGRGDGSSTTIANVIRSNFVASNEEDAIYKLVAGSKAPQIKDKNFYTRSVSPLAEWAKAFKSCVFVGGKVEQATTDKLAKHGKVKTAKSVKGGREYYVVGIESDGDKIQAIQADLGSDFRVNPFGRRSKN